MIVYQTSPQIIEGGQSKVAVTNITLEDLNDKILKQLEVMNIHLSILTDEELHNDNVNIGDI